MVLTKQDRQQLIKDFKEVFATKDDLDTKLKPITKDLKDIKIGLKEIRGALNPTIETQEHLTKRVDQLDDHLGLGHMPQPHHTTA